MSSVTEDIQLGRVECAICGLKPSRVWCVGWLFLYELAFCIEHKSCRAASAEQGQTK